MLAARSETQPACLRLTIKPQPRRVAAIIFVPVDPDGSLAVLKATRRTKVGRTNPNQNRFAVLRSLRAPLTPPSLPQKMCCTKRRGGGPPRAPDSAILHLSTPVPEGRRCLIPADNEFVKNVINKMT